MERKGGNKKVERIEASGKSVDDAVFQALVRLKKRRDEVEIAVLQEPSRGAFGLGNKEARVRVTVRPNNVGAIITPQMADAILGPEGTEAEGFGDEEQGEFGEDEVVEDGGEQLES